MKTMSHNTPIIPFVKPAVNFAFKDRLEDCIHSIPELIDFNSIHNENHPFCIQAKSDAPSDIFTHGDFKIALANCIQWIRDNVPLRKTTNPKARTKMAPVALFMQSDFGLVIYEFALISLGVPVRVTRLAIICPNQLTVYSLTAFSSVPTASAFGHYAPVADDIGHFFHCFSALERASEASAGCIERQRHFNPHRSRLSRFPRAGRSGCLQRQF